MTYWLFESCQDEAEWHVKRSQLEIPPPGYDGALTGTVWDPDAAASSYEGGDW